jgi:hypothetical protein
MGTCAACIVRLEAAEWCLDVPAHRPSQRTVDQTHDAKSAPQSGHPSAEQGHNGPDTPSERASNERHERHFSVKISPVTPTPHIMRTHEAAGQAPFATGSRIATHSTWCVIGKMSD